MSRRSDRIRAHQRKAHPGQEDLTILCLNVKLPDGVIINGQSGEVRCELSPSSGSSYSDHMNVLSQLHMTSTENNGKSADESLPTMVPPKLPNLPLLTVPNFSGPGIIGSGSENLTEASCYPSIKTEAGSGPVFPGQISPRIQNIVPTSSPPVVKDEQLEESKRIKLEHFQENQEFRSSSFPGSMIGNVGTTVNADSGNLANATNSKLNTGSSSRRKAQPMKREPDETQDDCAIISVSPSEEACRTPIPSFEGFGTTDFSSIGIPNHYVQNSSYGSPIHTGFPPVPRHMIAPGNHMGSSSGHMTFGIPRPGLAMEGKSNPRLPVYPAVTVGSFNGLEERRTRMGGTYIYQSATYR